MLIIDEADRMLDMGFIDDVDRIAALTPKTRQTVLFSATFDGAIARPLRRASARSPVRVDVKAEPSAPLAIEQRVPFRRRPRTQAPFARSSAGRHGDGSKHRLHRYQARRRGARHAFAGARPRGRRAAWRHESARTHSHTAGYAPWRRADAGRNGCRSARTRRRRYQSRHQFRSAAAGGGIMSHRIGRTGRAWDVRNRPPPLGQP